ncbi:uncharacterized protein LOC124257573 isoform X1 [Haliotis rubra]|uniref:uncharacterized protein LOC124257573 isoform X1 n=1 Tax=Haliotis rubra TaxID=36100 RepID=UPI001EE53B5C|nr:uncharacterized protein LOC124257573 isoform X1 [Haliotis rubra]
MRSLLWAILTITFYLGILIQQSKACFSNNKGDGSISPIILLANDDPRTLSSPGYPISYRPGTQCMWELQAVKLYARVKVTVLSMDLLTTVPTMCLHNVSLYEGYHGGVSQMSPAVILCNKDTTEFLSKGPDVTVVFKTNKLGSGKGFLLEYSQDNTLQEKSDPVPIFVGVLGFLGVIIFLVVCYALKKRQANQMAQRVPQHQFPRPPPRDLARPFLPNNDVTHTDNTSSNTRNTNNSRARNNNLPPTYQEVYIRPSTGTDLEPSAPPMPLPPSYEDAVSKGMILGDRETRL